jgi:putative transposase
MHITKQAIHQLIERRMLVQQQCNFLLRIVAEIRSDHPTLSCRAMYFKIMPDNIGRDTFEKMCIEHGYGIEQKKNSHRTTDSSGVIRFDNLIINLTLTDINQAFSSDITYFEINDRFYYITFVLDCYSRRILGHSVSQRLTTEQTTLPALKQAIEVRRNFLIEGVIFHSDGGGQYYDKAFLQLTKDYKMKNSMCEYAWENGKAERLNGIIKNNYLKHYSINSFEQLKKNVDRAVSLYNNDRPHKSLKYQTPIEYENKLLILQQQTKPKMTESLDAN